MVSLIEPYAERAIVVNLFVADCSECYSVEAEWTKAFSSKSEEGRDGLKLCVRGPE